jgi:hypothetical protein
VCISAHPVISIRRGAPAVALSHFYSCSCFNSYSDSTPIPIAFRIRIPISIPVSTPPAPTTPHAEVCLLGACCVILIFPVVLGGHASREGLPYGRGRMWAKRSRRLFAFRSDVSSTVCPMSRTHQLYPNTIICIMCHIVYDVCCEPYVPLSAGLGNFNRCFSIDCFDYGFHNIL